MPDVQSFLLSFKDLLKLFAYQVQVDKGSIRKDQRVRQDDQRRSVLHHETRLNQGYRLQTRILTFTIFVIYIIRINKQSAWMSGSHINSSWLWSLWLSLIAFSISSKTSRNQVQDSVSSKAYAETHRSFYPTRLYQERYMGYRIIQMLVPYQITVCVSFNWKC